MTSSVITDTTQEKKEEQVSSEPAGPSIAPAGKKDEEGVATAPRPISAANEGNDIEVGDGGAWGAGAAPGTFLARLIEEQTNEQGVESRDNREATTLVRTSEPQSGTYGSSDRSDLGGLSTQPERHYSSHGQGENEVGASGRPSSDDPFGGRGWSGGRGFRGGRGGRGFNTRGRGGWDPRGDPRKRQREDPRWRR